MYSVHEEHPECTIEVLVAPEDVFEAVGASPEAPSMPVGRKALVYLEKRHMPHSRNFLKI